MKTVKFNEEEVELLVALYEDELKEAETYIDKIRQTLGKLRKQGETVSAGPAKTGKKRGRKPKNQPLAPKPAGPGKKRGRKPKVQAVAITESILAPVKKAAKKRRTRKTKKRAVLKPKAPKAPKIETPVVEETRQG
jgi:hypothetical protein